MSQIEIDCSIANGARWGFAAMPARSSARFVAAFADVFVAEPDDLDLKQVQTIPVTAPVSTQTRSAKPRGAIAGVPVSRGLSGWHLALWRS